MLRYNVYIHVVPLSELLLGVGPCSGCLYIVCVYLSHLTNPHKTYKQPECGETPNNSSLKFLSS